ncbi:MAG: hypothetical protein ABEH77_05315 [Halobacteriaceae archaeon]
MPDISGWLAAAGGPGTALQAVDPSAVASAPVGVRAAASFLLVLAFGGAVLYRYEGFVGRAVESSMARPLVSVVYGLMAYGFVVFVGGYAMGQLLRVDVAVRPLVTVGLALVGGAVLTLAGLGYAVVGAGLTEVRGERRLWPGLVVGAALSGLVWLLLPFAAGVAAWVAVAAVGIGGPTRHWFHSTTAADRGG